MDGIWTISATSVTPVSPGQGVSCTRNEGEGQWRFGGWGARLCIGLSEAIGALRSQSILSQMLRFLKSGSTNNFSKKADSSIGRNQGHLKCNI